MYSNAKLNRSNSHSPTAEIALLDELFARRTRKTEQFYFKGMRSLHAVFKRKYCHSKAINCGIELHSCSRKTIG